MNASSPTSRIDPLLDADIAEYRLRKGVRSSLDNWARACDLVPAKHHQLINTELEAVERGDTRKLMLFLPPGSAKSTYATVLFPPWFIGRKRDRAILSISHNDNLVTTFGRRAREAINNHATELGYRLAKHSQAADRWETTNGGNYYATGAGAGISGFRADLGLIDDPIGKKEDADSKLMRDKIWAWYNYDFRPRLKPNGATVLIQTRWHEDDLAGRLLNSEPGEWRVISIPLIAVDNDPLGRLPGERLWPEWFNSNYEADARKDERAFNCLFQQNPTPETGNYFLNEWIQTYEPKDLPTNLRFYAASDHAVSMRQEADSTVLLIAGVDEKDNIWILADSIWFKEPTDVVVDNMLRLNKQFRPQAWWAGRDHITQSIGPFLDKRMMEEHNYIPMDEKPSTRHLTDRAQPIRGRMRSGKIFFPKRWTHWPAALHELLTFDKGTHDDFIAALSELGRGLADMVRARPVVAMSEPARLPLPTMGWIRKSSERRERMLHVYNMDK